MKNCIVGILLTCPIHFECQAYHRSRHGVIFQCMVGALAHLSNKYSKQRDEMSEMIAESVTHSDCVVSRLYFKFSETPDAISKFERLI